MNRISTSKSSKTSKPAARTAQKTGKNSAAKKSAPAAVRRGGSASPSLEKMVYFFGDKATEGNASMKNLLGGKGANLAEMAGLGLPVPPGFTITTEVCAVYDPKKGTYPKGLESQVADAVARLEKAMGKKFGDPANPLLVSVRSGARASMPGMMDTVLNLGLNDKTVVGLATASGNERFAWDSYRRFVQMYGDVVMGLKPESAKEADPFEAIIEKKKHKLGIELDTDMSASDLRELVTEFKDLVRKRCGRPFPSDPQEQLWGAIGAVFRSWFNERAVIYRKLNNIPESWGTAVNVQAMVFGNMGDDSATGVAFTRDPGTGEKRFFGEFLVNAQGEDVVAGIRTPQQTLKHASQQWAKENGVSEKDRRQKFPSLEELMPKATKELLGFASKLEKHYRDMQDMEFTIENSRLWMLQTRNGKRTATAAVRIAVEMEKEGLIDSNTAVLRVAPDQIDQLLHPTIDAKAAKTLLAKGLGASPGAAAGKVVFSADDAVEAKKNGEKVILVRTETSPEDIGGMNAAEGILTAKGGRTSHAAVVARGMGKCCVVGCETLRIDYNAERMTAGNTTVKAGDWITLDGSTGSVYVGQVPTSQAKLSGDFAKLMKWADKARRLKVRTNADTPQDARVAREFGAEGIGLCRTEHMFFEGDRIDAVREMILAADLKAREKALAKLLPYQRKDFVGIFKAMEGLPVTVRLLDPPLHEFLPHSDAEYAELAKKTGLDKKQLEQTGQALHEFNPMLGHRGCRLAITYPEIYAMQTRAIIEAAVEVAGKGVKVLPEIMIPLVATPRELERLRRLVIDTAEDVLAKKKKKLAYTVGTMIEVPRAALTADEIARQADFFSFGTNDLTQMGFGLSRDDSGRFLPAYVDQGVLDEDPFVSIDQAGIGELMKIASEKGRSVKPDLKLGICGEHGGDPRSVIFCHKIGLDYVSCSPYRVPVARLAAAHAALS
ncbi:MAG TPA: pyruvate, phosphate dikinase [Candidatus Limnocylindrales bacterium]|nr:pyruvate, phosphate dikinase [Candidatus Limnocylindrales bacterium]